MPELSVGDERVVEIGPIAHGGHFIAHSDDRTLFVRHALPGEQVRVRVTDLNRRIVRADVVEVLSASADRITSPCRWAGQCGGCDFQHVTLQRQRDLKTQVLRESLVRFGRLDTDDPLLDVTVDELPDAPDGLRWRTRMTWAQAEDGSVGLRRHHSHDIVAVGECLLATPDVAIARPAEPGKVVREVRGRAWRLSSDAFWQVHRALPEALVDTVLAFGQPMPGDTWLDLYSGVGLFSAFLADAVAPTGTVHAVESDERAVRDARRAMHDLPAVRLHAADVGKWLLTDDAIVDGVVLDPPRAGAGETVVKGVARRSPRAVVYVACDPVTLSRDVALFAETGYRLAAVRAFDAFPMTHHFESVALLTRG
jgi:tRNA/tmRNA/rRNA uracil-C5-methylase (TrmA/RlmC/RlmD family)